MLYLADLALTLALFLGHVTSVARGDVRERQMSNTVWSDSLKQFECPFRIMVYLC